MVEIIGIILVVGALAVGFLLGKKSNEAECREKMERYKSAWQAALSDPRITMILGALIQEGLRSPTFARVVEEFMHTPINRQDPPHHGAFNGGEQRCERSTERKVEQSHW